MLEVLSLGGGTQSTALLLMAIDGHYQLPDVVIFSDTGAEMPHTYKTVAQCAELCEKNGIPFYTVQSHFSEDAKHPGSWAIHEHYFEMGQLPMVGNPRCTFNFKIYPIRRKVRELLAELPHLQNAKRGETICHMWIGITTDERSRSQHAEDLKWAKNKYPLLELSKSRDECVSYIKAHYPHIKVQKSGCWMCPYQSPKGWAKLRREHPEKFRYAREMEKKAAAQGIKRGLFGTKSILAFDSDFTLEDFGLLSDEGETCSATSGGCFI